MASDTQVVVEYSAFGELPILTPAAQDGYGSLFNNGIHLLFNLIFIWMLM